MRLDFEKRTGAELLLDSQLDVHILRSQQIWCYSPQRFQIRSENAYFQLSISSVQHVIHYYAGQNVYLLNSEE